MRFDIQPSSTEPIYRQIVEQVRRHVASGRASTGDEMPSVRTLAEQHAINPMTVSKAYSLLEGEGLLERRRGQGMVVAASGRPMAPTKRLALLEPALREAARQVAQLGATDDEAMRLFERCLRDQAAARPAGRRSSGSS